jgi:hypothetical protein
MDAVYCGALQELMPEAFEQLESHAVQRPLGIYVFHSVMRECVNGHLEVRGCGQLKVRTLGRLLRPS